MRYAGAPRLREAHAIVENIFFARDPDPAIRKGLITTLAGDVWRDDNEFQKMLLSSKRRRFEPYAVSEV
jgi:hypothetical protein